MFDNCSEAFTSACLGVIFPSVCTQSFTCRSEGCGIVYPANNTLGLRRHKITKEKEEKKGREKSLHHLVVPHPKQKINKAAVLGVYLPYLLFRTSTITAPSVWSSLLRVIVSVFSSSSLSAMVSLSQALSLSLSLSLTHLHSRPSRLGFFPSENRLFRALAGNFLLT